VSSSFIYCYHTNEPCSIIMAGTEPFPYQSSGYLPKLEANFMRDFTCCGQTLPTLHDLLLHYEEAHAQQTPQSLRAASATAQPSPLSQHTEQQRHKRARLSSHPTSPPNKQDSSGVRRHVNSGISGTSHYRRQTNDILPQQSTPATAQTKSAPPTMDGDL
jgi:hypothetical protein